MWDSREGAWEWLQREMCASGSVSSLAQCFPLLGRVSALDRRVNPWFSIPLPVTLLIPDPEILIWLESMVLITHSTKAVGSTPVWTIDFLSFLGPFQPE